MALEVVRDPVQSPVAVARGLRGKWCRAKFRSTPRRAPHAFRPSREPSQSQRAVACGRRRSIRACNARLERSSGGQHPSGQRALRQRANRDGVRTEQLFCDVTARDHLIAQRDRCRVAVVGVRPVVPHAIDRHAACRARARRGVGHVHLEHFARLEQPRAAGSPRGSRSTRRDSRSKMRI